MQAKNLSASKQPAYGESARLGPFSARARLSALAEERRPHGERMKVRGCKDADKLCHRTGHLESIGVSS